MRHLPAWNFSKYVIGKDGKIREVIASDIPVARNIEQLLEKALAAADRVYGQSGSFTLDGDE